MAVLAAVQDVVPTWLDRTLYPFESRWIDIDGNRIHYVDEGKGPILLLLHGNGSWSFLYRHMIFRLAGQFRCIALDHAGFGLSRARPGFSFKPRAHSAVLESFVRGSEPAGHPPCRAGLGGSDRARFRRLAAGPH
jgi:haloalkane dehalogenase